MNRLYEIVSRRQFYNSNDMKQMKLAVGGKETTINIARLEVFVALNDSYQINTLQFSLLFSADMSLMSSVRYPDELSLSLSKDILKDDKTGYSYTMSFTEAQPDNVSDFESAFATSGWNLQPNIGEITKPRRDRLNLLKYSKNYDALPMPLIQRMRCKRFKPYSDCLAFDGNGFLGEFYISDLNVHTAIVNDFSHSNIGSVHTGEGDINNE
jgi:hypothetical protein